MGLNSKFFVVILILSLLSYTNAFDNLLDAFTQFGIIKSIYDMILPRIPIDNNIYDFIVVGGGTAGSVLANRLSENPNWRIALIEAGSFENFFNLVPALCSYMQLTEDLWKYKTIPQERACYGMYNNQCCHPRGKIMGGTSSINFMIYNRGNYHDFNEWSEAGNYGWSYEEVLPYFLKSEMANNLNGLEENTRYHNKTGPLSVAYVQYRTSIVEAFIEGAQQAGHMYTDYNGETQKGVSYVQTTTKNGRRHSAYRAYIEAIRSTRSNLQIFTYAQVTKVLIDPETKAAYGVEFLFRNKLYKFKARKEVILSAGSFNSAQLLMLSGIGPKDDLINLDINVLQDLPVGKIMYEHASHFGPTFLVNTTQQTYYTDRFVPDVPQFLNGKANTRVSTIGTVEALTFLKVPQSNRSNDWPDCELIFAAGSFASDDGTGLKNGANLKDEIYDRIYRPLQLSRQDHFSFLVMPFHPKSQGRVYLKSKDPLDPPMIDANYFQDPIDLEIMLEGIKAAKRIIQTPAMQSIGATILDTPLPGCELYLFDSDDYWRCSIRTLTYTLHHQVATCRMGNASDPTAVVSPELKVHGIRKLRVVDGSIIPFPPTAHTNAPVFMIGEKAADMIKNDW